MSQEDSEEPEEQEEMPAAETGDVESEVDPLSGEISPNSGLHRKYKAPKPTP